MNTTRTVARVATMLALTLSPLAACGGGDDDASAPAGESVTDADATSGGAASGTDTITIDSFTFGGVSSVAVGTTVTIVNDDSVAHTFTADDGSFDTGKISPGESAQVTFETAGDFGYHCGFHQSMTGSITVTG